MANDKICVFCGEKTGAFRTTYIICGGAYQTCCKECAKEVNDLTQYEQCRRALKLGLASYPEMLEKLNALGQELGMEIRMQRSEIFDAMHRI